VKNFFQLAEIADEAARVGIDSGDLETVHHGTRLSVWSCPEPCGKPALNPAPQSALNLRGSLLNSTLQGVLALPHSGRQRRSNMADSDSTLWEHIPCPSCGTELEDTRELVLQCWFCALVFLADWQERKSKHSERAS